jgi:membrane-bound lytic murein transglycosylase D
MIYDIIDFSNLGTSGLNKISRELIKKDLIVNMVKELENNIKKNKLNLLKLSKLQIKNRFKTSSMRAKSISLIRSQIGQKAFFGQGMGNFEIYAPYINYMLDLHSLPKEMVSIAFVESSFNNEAHSKAQAKGVWQVMPQISERLLGECFGCDYRDDTLLSTWMASYLLRENLMILKDLPLAVTAYNSGIGPILTTKSQTKKKIKKFDIQSYFTHVKDKSIGFASRNYYSEFVAATIALAYRDELYQIPFSQISSKNFRIAISQCDFKYNPGQFWDNTAAPVNQHLSPGRTYKKGTFIITDKVKLPKFIILDSLPAFGKRPITVVEKLLKKNYRCSTK